MSHSIDESQVRHIAHLARLSLNDAQLALYRRQLGDILTYVNKLNQVNTEGVEPTAHPLEVINVFREDVSGAPLGIDAVLANTPERDHPYFKVPKVLEQGSA